MKEIPDIKKQMFAEMSDKLKLEQLIKMSFKNETMDSPYVFEKGSKCPNSWVIPSFSIKLWLVSFIIY